VLLSCHNSTEKWNLAPKMWYRQNPLTWGGKRTKSWHICTIIIDLWQRKGCCSSGRARLGTKAPKHQTSRSDRCSAPRHCLGPGDEILNVSRAKILPRQNRFIFIPFYRRACRWDMLGELKPIGPKGPETRKVTGCRETCSLGKSPDSAPSWPFKSRSWRALSSETK
jgi:hypothetical protein